MPEPFRLLVTGSRTWDDVTGLSTPWPRSSLGTPRG